MLRLEGFEAGRKHVRTLMGRMSIAAIYRKRNTSAPHPDRRNFTGETGMLVLTNRSISVCAAMECINCPWSLVARKNCAGWAHRHA